MATLASHHLVASRIAQTPNSAAQPAKIDTNLLLDSSWKRGYGGHRTLGAGLGASSSMEAMGCGGWASKSKARVRASSVGASEVNAGKHSRRGKQVVAGVSTAVVEPLVEDEVAATAGLVGAPHEGLVHSGGLHKSGEFLRVMPDSLQYPAGYLGGISEKTKDLELSNAAPTAISYLTRILTSKVYDVAIESPLELARKVSERLGVRMLLKREDMQPVSILSSLMVPAFVCMVALDTEFGVWGHDGYDYSSVVKTARLNVRACQSEVVVNLRSWKLSRCMEQL